MRVLSVAPLELRWPITTRGAARGTSTTRAAVFVAATTEAGETGLGEAAPLPGFSLDDLDDARAAVASLAAHLPVEVPGPDHALALADRVTVAPAARFAIETTLLVACAQRSRTSVARLLAAAPRDALPVSMVVDSPAEASEAAARGARCLKIKVGGPPDSDLARVHAIAQAAPAARLRLDANRGWTASDVTGIFAALRALPIEYVEEPCPDSHRLLDQDLPLSIALDESLITLDRDDLDRALASRRLAALVLKPTLLGGFARCLELAALARRHGVAPVVTHSLEGPVGTSACGELARAIGGEVAVGLAAHPALDHFGDAA